MRARQNLAGENIDENIALRFPEAPLAVPPLFNMQQNCEQCIIRQFNLLCKAKTASSVRGASGFVLPYAPASIYFFYTAADHMIN